MTRVNEGRRGFILACLLGGVLLFAAADAARAQVDGRTAFERIKQLAGDWEADWEGREYGPGTSPLRVRYEVTTGGTVVREIANPGGAGEMTTQYYLDAQDLLVTHYCLFGNQPTMGLEPSLSTPEAFHFSLRRVSGLMGHGDCLYMILEALLFINPGELRTRWSTHREDGSLVEVHDVLLRRVAPPGALLDERKDDYELNGPGSQRQR